MKTHKLLLDCPKFNIREEISANLLYETLKGLPENPDERLRHILDSWLNGLGGEISDADLRYAEENLAQTHHGSEHRLGLVGRIAAEDYEGIVGGEITDRVENIQSGIVLAMALKRFRMLSGFSIAVVWLLLILPMYALASLPPKILDKLKNATVLVVQEDGSESRSGSGFIVCKEGKTGFVITNAHVIFSSQKKVTISVVLKSGTAEASVLKAEVSGMNISADLAVLKIMSEELPDPIQISQNTEVSETQEVFILGFPFGTMLSTNRQTPAITISQGIVSSKRRDENDQIFLIQIDGGVNKGNSGGPIVTKDGEMIGVAVAAIKETNIGFAVPERKVRAIMDGIVANVALSADKKEESDLFINGDVIDPLDRIKSASLVVVPEKDLVPAKFIGANGNWNSIASGKEAIVFNRVGNHRVKAKIKADILQKSNNYYAQVVIETKGNHKIHQPPFKILYDKTVDNVELIGPDALPIKPESKLKGKKSPDLPSPSEEPPRKKSRLKDQKSSDSSEKSEDTISDNAESIKTHAPIEDVILAGGGKYLIFRYSRESRLDIFDVKENKWHKQIVIPDYDFYMAANRDKLLIGTTSRNRLMRIDLDTLKVEHSAEVPEGSRIKAMAIGWDSSNTPLLLLTSESLQFIDINTLDPIKLEWSNRKPYLSEQEVMQVRASANGRVFTFWGTRHSPEGVNLIWFTDRQIHHLNEHDTAGYLAPSPNGNIIYTNLKGMYNSKLKMTGSEKFKNTHLFPGTDEKYFLSVRYENKNPTLSVHDVSDHHAVFSLNNLSEMKNDFHPMHFHRQLLSEEKRFYLFPDIKKLITIPFSDDVICIRSIDIESKHDSQPDIVEE